MLVGDVVERHLLGAHEVAQAHLVRLDAEVSRAIASSISSIAKQTPVRATPRYGRIGGLLVATDQVRQR